MLFDQFDEVRIINLAHRKDRCREMQAEFARQGIEIDGKRIAFFDACKVSDKGKFYSAGAHGCFLSHLTVLEQAKGSILVLEDDCDFAPGAAGYTVPECDIFYGGYYATTEGPLQQADIIGAHMMGYFNPAHVAAYYRTIMAENDHVPVPDGAAVWYRRAHPEVRAVFATPPLAHQRSSRTDVAEPHWIDRMPMAGSLARKIRKLITA